jgi:hypothetical protein
MDQIKTGNPQPQPRKQKLPIAIPILCCFSVIIGLGIALLTSRILHGESKVYPSEFGGYPYQRAVGIPLKVYDYYHSKDAPTRAACNEINRKNAVCGYGSNATNKGDICVLRQGECLIDNLNLDALILNTVFWSVLVFGVLFFIQHLIVKHRKKLNQKVVDVVEPTELEKPKGE